MYTNRIFSFLIAVLLSVLDVSAQSVDGWKEEQGVYARVHDAPLRLIDGKETSIRQMASEKPIVLALIFTRCSGVCNPFILKLKQQLVYKEDALDFQLVVLSFDPRDRIDDMQAYARQYDLADQDNWYFAVTSQIPQLKQSLKFDPVWDSIRQQFEHDALLVGINNEGYITKKLLGLRNYRDLAKLSASIHNEFSPTYRLPGQNQMFSCFNYDPRTGKSTPGLGLLFIALPAVIAFMLLFGIRFLVKQN